MISVIVTTYERRALLARTLASVYAQTTADREVIVVDDGSTDGTAEFLRSQPVSMIAMGHCGNPAGSGSSESAYRFNFASCRFRGERPIRLVRPDTIDPGAEERSIFAATVFRQIVMVVVRFVKWSGPDIAVNPGQTSSTGYMCMLVFGN